MWKLVCAEMSRGPSLQAGDSLAMPMEPLSPTRQVRICTHFHSPLLQEGSAPWQAAHVTLSVYRGQPWVFGSTNCCRTLPPWYSQFSEQ